MSFLTDIRRFSNRITSIWRQTNNIFGISTKNWADQCVFEIVSTTFFWSNFYPWYPPGICEKMNLFKKSSGYWKASSKLVKCYFMTKVLVNKQWNSCFNQISFFTYPWGVPGGKIWLKTKVAATISNTHRWTQLFVLIPDMIFLWSQRRTVLFKTHRISVKKDRNWVLKAVLEQKCFSRHRISRRK